ncbi:MAG TPA: ABC transporter ATP-binding protein [Dehalococcoidales bacterium]|nr:ABC transporter ATP-binding protein [Dehalococcoidales bacterium]
MSDIIVETRDLSRAFRVGSQEIMALDSLSLQIAKGEFVGIMGPSGSGKTTLLNLLGCLDQPSSGSIVFEGQDISGLNEREIDDLRLKRMGFIFQTFNLMPTFTALENVAFPMEIAGIPRDERTERARQLLRQLGLIERIHHKPRELSAGENQRVAIARALANNPSVILADEPTGNLDSRTTEEISQLLSELNTEYQVAIILVTHDASVAQAASRRLWMIDGRLDHDPDSR